MQRLLQTRADARALFSAALAGAAVGLALGACYLAGGMASAASHHFTASRVADAANGAYSDVALISAPGADAGALAVMRRRDPAGAIAVEQDRQLAQLADRLQSRAGAASANAGAGILLRASLGGAYNPAAAPFQGAALQGSRELECLTQAVYYESRGEGPSGQAAVAQVVLNRVRHPAFPKSICGVVFQRAGQRSGCQFSFACDGSLYRPREKGAWNRAQRVATRALAGSVMAEVGAATHFHTTNVAPSWGPGLLRVAQVGLHVFYRSGGRSGRAFVRTPDVTTPADPAADLMVASLAAGKAASNVALAAVATTAPTLVSGGVGGPAAAAPEPASAPAEAKAPVDAPKAEKTAAATPAPALKAATAS